MGNIINYKRIRTNNLKGFDFQIKMPSFIGISGPSGSGKSSLAYGTIYAIAKKEWNMVSGENDSLDSSFVVDGYSNVVPAVALVQDNHNANPRSTIGSFLHIDQLIRMLFAETNDVSPSLFSFNNPKSVCSQCDGLGIEYRVSEMDVVDFDKNIVQGPFSSWRGRYQQKVLEKFALDQGIPLDVPMGKLSKNILDKLLNYETVDKYRVTYSMNGKKHTKEFHYVGIMREIERCQADKKHISAAQKIKNLGKASVCSACGGSRFSKEICKYKYQGFSIGDILLMEFDELQKKLENMYFLEKKDSLKSILEQISVVVKGIVDVKLEYLNLNRSIPSLSGGELQRIRLVNILKSQVSNMMYVVDEPSARLHVSEYPFLLKRLQQLKAKGNIVLMIEHNPYFLSKTDCNVFIGPGAGIYGGNIVKVLPSPLKIRYTPRLCNDFFEICNISEHTLRNVHVSFPRQRITVILGPSGSGKSTLIKNIEYRLDNCEFVNQLPLRGSVASTVASFCGVMDELRDSFASKNKVNRNYFSFLTKEGACSFCEGKGFIKRVSSYGGFEIETICEDCHGQRFSMETLKYRLKGLNIYQVMTKTIDELVEMEFYSDNSRISKLLALLQKIGLGYLSLFRTTDTLSGGECQRLKLVRALMTSISKKIYLFDEPLRGLGESDSVNILKLFESLSEKGATIICVEHNVLSLDFCDYVIEMGPGQGNKGGKIVFEGCIEEFKKDAKYKKYTR